MYNTDLQCLLSFFKANLFVLLELKGLLSPDRAHFELHGAKWNSLQRSCNTYFSKACPFAQKCHGLCKSEYEKSLIDLVLDSSSKKACLRIATSQVEDVEAELRFPHVQKFTKSRRGFVALRNTANCPSNVRWRRLQTFGRFLYTLTEHTSLWSMSLLSSKKSADPAKQFITLPLSPI